MIIVDTGAWIGLANQRDRYHTVCREFFRVHREPLITTCPVLVETTHLLFGRVGIPLTLVWWDSGVPGTASHHPNP